MKKLRQELIIPKITECKELEKVMALLVFICNEMKRETISFYFISRIYPCEFLIVFSNPINLFSRLNYCIITNQE